MTSIRRWAVRGGVGALLAGSVVAGGWAVADAAGGPSSSRAPGSVADESSAASSTPSGTGAFGGGAPGGAWRGAPGGRFRMGGGGSITAITSDSVTVKSPFGAMTILTTSQTAYVEAMSLVPRSDLKVGQRVDVTVKPEAPPAGWMPNWSRTNAPSIGSSGNDPSTTSSATTPSRPTAEAIEIVIPQLSGRVASVSPGKIVVEGPSGLQQTLVTSGSTSYRELGTTVSASEVAAGEYVVGFGSVAADHTELDATTVAVVGPLAVGKVTGVSGSTITVQSPRGTLRIVTGSSTVFRTNAGSSSLASVKAGDFVVAIGRQSGTTGFTASGLWSGTTFGASPGLGITSGPGQPAFGAPGGFGGPFGGHGFGGFRGRPAGSPPSGGSSGATIGSSSGTATA